MTHRDRQATRRIKGIKLPGRTKAALLERLSTEDEFDGRVTWCKEHHEIGANCRPQAMFSELICERENCGNQWRSGKITALVCSHRIDDSSIAIGVYCTIQRCKECHTKGRMINQVDSDSVDRLFQKCRLILGMREAMEAGEKGAVQTKPHRAELCDACKVGVCVVALSERFSSRVKM